MTNKAGTAHPEQATSQIKGTVAITKTVSSGLFLCPTEATERAYWHKRVRNWTSVFSFPVIPGEVVEEYVECFCCGATVDPRILTSSHPSLRTPRGATKS